MANPSGSEENHHPWDKLQINEISRTLHIRVYMISQRYIDLGYALYLHGYHFQCFFSLLSLILKAETYTLIDRSVNTEKDKMEISGTVFIFEI